jgi:hypothetical protein
LLQLLLNGGFFGCLDSGAADAANEQEEHRLQQLQEQLVNWQKQLITNQNVLQEHVDMPLQSLQVGLKIYIFYNLEISFLCLRSENLYI